MLVYHTTVGLHHSTIVTKLCSKLRPPEYQQEPEQSEYLPED